MPNPIADRLDQLGAQWTAFAGAPKARVLRWLVDPDEVSMVSAFLERESDEQGAELPDGFLELDTPFEGGRSHGVALVRDLIEQYEAAKDPLAKDGMDSPWRAPAVVRGDDVATLVAALASFKKAHGPEEALLAVHLFPRAIADAGAYGEWLGRLAAQAPHDLRFIVLDAAAKPKLEALRTHGERVVSVAADLDMPEAASELSQAAGNLETPGGRFRQLFVAIGAAGKRGDLASARALSDEASALAGGTGWFHLVVAARFALGAVLGQAGQHLEAAKVFAEAEKAGVDSEGAGDPVGPRLQLQSRLARGSSLITLGAFSQAAAHFVATTPLAVKVGDQRAELDCRRLASYCFEQAGKIDEAWEEGLAGLKLGKSMDAETRRTSTLPYLADQMLRLTEQRKLRAFATPLEQQIVSLLGKTWRPDPKAPPPPIAT